MRHWPVVLLTMMTACSPDYPLDRPGTWHAESNGMSANDANLRAMIADPHDLVEGAGTGTGTALGAEAATPVRRLLTAHRQPLPSSGVAQLQLTGAPPAAAQGDDNAQK